MIEQFFDYIKSYGKLTPIRKHTMSTVYGHVLMSFIAAFLAVLIKNRLNIIDLPYVAVPLSIADEADKLSGIVITITASSPLLMSSAFTLISDTLNNVELLARLNWFPPKYVADALYVPFARPVTFNIALPSLICTSSGLPLTIINTDPVAFVVTTTVAF